ncbi:MAG: hypothetical protein JXA42_16575, partial [Anaerolineales bacterium]|nr:hypothetical protein [Anaerolineales bacterium]
EWRTRAPTRGYATGIAPMGMAHTSAHKGLCYGDCDRDRTTGFSSTASCRAETVALAVLAGSGWKVISWTGAAAKADGRVVGTTRGINNWKNNE